MNIITISREFGSGGRELGKRLADELGVPCYDQELIEEAARQQGMEISHVERISEQDIRIYYPRTIGHRFSFMSKTDTRPFDVAVALQESIRRFASQGDCVIVGRCADVILREMKPFNIFVYADPETKLNRCRERASKDETFSVSELSRKIKQVDKDRAAYRDLFSDIKWGQKEAYHLCINTSGKEIKTLVPAIAEYARLWFKHN